MALTLIDVSAAQGRIYWPKVFASGLVDLALIKATEGNGYTDPAFAANFEGALTLGLLAGTYHFAHADERDGDAAAEAAYYVSSVVGWASKGGRIVPDLLWALDIEEARKIRSGPTFVRWCRTFVETVERLTGRVCWVYTGGPFWDEHDGDISPEDAAFFAARPLWLAAYVRDPAPFVRKTPWRDWTLWQFAGDVQADGRPGLRYPGIAENVVDTNRFRGSREEFWAIVRRPPPVLLPAPPPSDEPTTVPDTPAALESISVLDGPATPLRAGPGEHTVPTPDVDLDH